MVRATHRAAFGAIISRRSFGSRGSSSTRGACLALLPPFSFGSLEGKGPGFKFQGQPCTCLEALCPSSMFILQVALHQHPQDPAGGQALPGEGDSCSPDFWQLPVSTGPVCTARQAEESLAFWGPLSPRLKSI
jgi:hypothetical protein